MVRFITVALAVAMVSGCSTVKMLPEDQVIKDDQIVDVDPDELDRSLFGELPLEETPPHVRVGEKASVSIEMDKKESEWHEQTQSYLQRWTATAINMNNEPKCVTPMWRLMEFEYTSFGPSEQMIPSLSSKVIGEFHQRTWQLGDVWLAPAPSGYLHAMRVRGTVPGAKVGEECNWITPDDEVINKPKETVDIEL